MAQPDNAASIHACAMRLARLAADGTTPAGASNGYITKNFITLSYTPDVDEGTDHSVPNACGDVPYPVKDRPIIKRWNLELEMLIPDPEITELLVSAALILSTPAAARTPTGDIVSGSTTVSNISGGVTNLDMGATIAATGIPASTTIVEILSASSVRISAAASATTVGVALAVTPVAQSVGASSPPLGVQASDNGISLEVWTNAYVGGAPAPVLPFFKYAFPRTYWRLSDTGFANARQSPKFSGYGVENIQWGNGPWNDWVDASPSTKTLSRAWGWHRTSTLPAPAIGYTAVPTQV